MSSVGKLIYERRRRLDWTLSDIAREVHRSIPYISELERGLTRGTPETLRAIAAVLGIDNQELYDSYMQDIHEAGHARWVLNTHGEYHLQEEYTNVPN